MKKKLGAILILFFCLFLSCERPTDSFERNNVKDPLHQDFENDIINSLDITFDTEGIITVRWTETANFEDGFIIEKSLSDSTSFLEIGRVGENVNSFQDSSRQVREDTFYKVTPYMVRDDDVKRFKSFTRKMTTIGTITEFEYQYNSDSKSLDLNWKTNSPFISKFRVEYRTESEEKFKVLQELDPDQFQLTDDLSDIAFENREYKLGILLIGDNYEEEFDQKIKVFHTDIFDPSELTLEIEDEQAISVSWKDNSYFEDGFKLYRSFTQFEGDYELIAELGENETFYRDKLDLVNGRTYRYKIHGYLNDSNSNSLAGYTIHSIPKPYLFNDRYSNINSHSIKLNWDIDSEKLPVEFILEKKVHLQDSSWEVIGTFDKGIKSFTDTAIDPLKSYRYRLKTISSAYSNELPLSYRNLYNKIAELNNHSRGISDLAFSPDGNYLASSSNVALGYGDTYVNVWDLNSMDTYSRVDFHERPITSVHFSSDGMMLASGSWFDNTVNVYSFPEGELIQSFSGVVAYDVKFSPDNNYIASTGGFGSVMKWNIETGELIFFYQGNGSPTSTPHSLKFKPDGSEIAVDDRGLVILNANTGEQVVKLYNSFTRNESHPNNIGYSHDGSKIVFTFLRMDVYDTNNWSLLFTVPNIGIYLDNRHGKHYPTFHPFDNTIVAAAGSRKINFRNIENGEILNRLSVSKNMTFFTYSPDGSSVAIGFDDSSIEIWKESTQRGWKELIPY